MSDDDINAFRSPTPSSPMQSAARSRRLWPWVVLALLLMMLFTAGALALLFSIVSDYGSNPYSVTIDGDTWRLGALHSVHGMAALMGVLVALLIVVVIGVPLVVLSVLLAAAVSVGLALLAALVTVGIALSPLWLLTLLVWWAVRPRRPPVLATTR